jgi:hypothetical protein
MCVWQMSLYTVNSAVKYAMLINQEKADTCHPTMQLFVAVFSLRHLNGNNKPAAFPHSVNAKENSKKWLKKFILLCTIEGMDGLTDNPQISHN